VQMDGGGGDDGTGTTAEQSEEGQVKHPGLGRAALLLTHPGCWAAEAGGGDMPAQGKIGSGDVVGASGDSSVRHRADSQSRDKGARKGQLVTAPEQIRNHTPGPPTHRTDVFVA
jgi:hypothetical protein